MSAPLPQKNNPLHGLTLAHILTALQAHYGWEGLADRIPLRCFDQDPTINSSLKFLRKTPWAREKVEGLYLFMQREQRRRGLPPVKAPAPVPAAAPSAAPSAAPTAAPAAAPAAAADAPSPATPAAKPEEAA